MKTRRLTKKEMIIFALGQLGWSLLSGIISAWLVTYYLPTSGATGDIAAGATQYIVPGLVIGGFMTVLGLITALSRIFDAVTDPLIASLSDRSTNKRGRRIPFMQVAAIPFAVVTVLLFCAPVAKQSGWNIAWISIFIVLFYTFMTMYCTPYNALISEFGKTQEDRMFISTSISLTFFFGTLIAYLPFVLAGAGMTEMKDAAGNVTEIVRSAKPITAMLENAGMAQADAYAWSFRICFIFLAVIACVCMLLPTFLLKEREFVDSKPSKENVFKSLVSTFKNKDFRTFSLSDLTYWVGLTMFQTGLPFFVKVSLGFDAGMVMVFMGGMTVLSAVFYPFVTKMVMKFGKKKLVIAGFLGLAICYTITAISSIPGFLPKQGSANGLSWAFGIVIMLISALPMALLGIIPQSIVADVAEAEAKTTGQNREGMFFAARTFAMKLGQSIAMILFTSLAIIGATVDKTQNDISATKIGMLIVAVVAVAFCILGAIILAFYREKKIMLAIAKEEDKAFLNAIKDEKDSGEQPAEEGNDVSGDNAGEQ